MTLGIRKLIVVSLVGAVVLFANFLLIAHWLKEKGVIGDTPVGAVPLPVMRMFVQFPLTSYQNMGALHDGMEKDYREQLGLPVEDQPAG